MQGNVLGQTGSSLKINGLIEEYKVVSGGNINAGDFVSFVNESISNENEFEVNNNAGSSSANISAVLLSENKVFVAYSSSNYYLYGLVCTIDGKNITMGNTTQLSSISNSGYLYKSVTVLDNNTVFIAHSVGSSFYLYGLICTIDGTEITIGTDTKLSSSSYSGDLVSTTKLTSNKVFVTVGSSGSGYLYGLICTIDGTEITTGISTKICDKENYKYNLSVVTLNENKIFIICSDNDSSSRSLYGTVCTVDGTTITHGISTYLGETTYYEKTAETVLLSENKVFVVRIVKNNDEYYIYGIICTIDGTTITKGVDTQLLKSEQLSDHSEISVTALDTDKIFIVDSRKEALLCVIEETTIKTVENLKFSNVDELTYQPSIAKVNKDKALIVYVSSNEILYGTIMQHKLSGIAKSNTDQIIGISKTKGNEGEIVQVYVPKVEHYLVTEDGEQLVDEEGEIIKCIL